MKYYQILYCKKGLIRVNHINDILTSNESLENCQNLCNESDFSDADQTNEHLTNDKYTGSCKYISYSNSLDICNLYKEDVVELCDEENNRTQNENFTTYKRNQETLKLNI